ncbi:N-acetyltransferase [Candidatus Spongiihabitans sp.]|uniref:N-acetyltransferase n=1 Tax=Candidatus Spongiihabitans sp. TaxID=3101308 RepID=UPI003C7D86E5
MNAAAANDAYPIRHAQLEDVPSIYSLLKHYSDKGVLLPRPQSDIYASLRDFYVVAQGGKIIACAALLIYTKELGEVRSLAVHPAHMKLGLGNKMVRRLEQDANHLGLVKLMALTYEVNFFEKMNFEVVAMSALPEKVWGACINCHKFRNCDEIAVLKYI